MAPGPVRHMTRWASKSKDATDDARRPPHRWRPRRRGSPTALDLASNVTVTRSLRRVRSLRPWRTGCLWLHPWSVHEFLETSFRQREPLCLQRGPRHPLPLSSSTAADLLHSYRMGINAHVVESRGQPKRGQAVPHLGLKPLQVLAMGHAVRLERLELRRASSLRRSSLWRSLEAVAPGPERSPSLSLTWAPPMVSSCPGGRGVSTNSTSHQLHLQLFGARRWTLCATSPTPARETWECQHVTLRRGDLLYVPPGLRHYASAGAALSAHLTLQLQPLTLHELLSAAGGGGGGIRPSSLLAEPLPLWRNANATCLAEMCPSVRG
ncbi:Hypothetical protein (Fragment), partial [Durusdinium trenchii]